MYKVAGLVGALMSVNAKIANVVTEKEIRIKLDAVPLEVQNDKATEIVRITQGFIAELDGGCDVRVRSSVSADGKAEYSMACKYRPLFQEAEMEISEEMFSSLITYAIKSQTKDRYKWEGWDIDVIDKESGLEVWAEFELNPNGGFPVIPESFKTDANVQDLVKEIEATAETYTSEYNTKAASLLDGFLIEIGL